MSSIAKILLVDDNPKYLKDVLPTYGYDIKVATDGIQALKILGNHENQKQKGNDKTKQRRDGGDSEDFDHIPFDLILLDVMMPNMDGWATLKAIREDNNKKSIPIIMLTALDKEQQQISGLKFGADDYIVKPFTLPNLLARIEALLRRSKWKQENCQTTPSSLSFASDEPIDTLTARETEVLSLVAQGSNNQEIAEKLFVREVTVKTHLNNIFKKLNVSNRTQAVLLAMQLKII
ncbi:MAG: response regulator transcription factor [bacterium]